MFLKTFFLLYSIDSSISNSQPNLIVCRFKPVIDKRRVNANNSNYLLSGEYNGMPSSVGNSHHHHRSENKDFLPFSDRYSLLCCITI